VRTPLLMNSTLRQTFRRIAAAVVFGAFREKARVMLVTSPRPQEGRTTTALHLAIAMAQSGQRTLLVEADLRSPTLATYFGTAGPQDQGLAGVVYQMCSLPQAIHATGVDRLNFLDCGPLFVEPLELLNHKRFAMLLRILACQYDRIVLDSPALLTCPDALILAAISDGVLVVLDGRKCDRPACVSARQELGKVCAKVIGAVVNRAAGRHDVQSPLASPAVAFSAQQGARGAAGSTVDEAVRC